jgi:putative ABC transport system ATP-binding protein/lipoprotein-releasing system ATP-binding protein
MSSIYVSLKDAGRTYLQGKIPVQVLTSITGAVVPGDRIAVVGPSGSGKSTLLHLMGGLDTPTSGSISWPELGPKRDLRPKKIGFIFQTESLLAPLTVVENVELPFLLAGVKPLEARAAAMTALKDIDLETIADKLPEELSGGQAQRVAVARVLSSRPKLILADEPTGQLDHPTAQRLFDVLLACIENSDSSLIVATHDPAIAGRLRKAWHLRYGRLEVEQ